MKQRKVSVLSAVTREGISGSKSGQCACRLLLAAGRTHLPPVQPVLMSHALVPCCASLSASMAAYLKGWGGEEVKRLGRVCLRRREDKAEGGKLAGIASTGRQKRTRWCCNLQGPCVPRSSAQAASQVRQPLPYAHLKGCSTRNALPKQAEKVAVGSVTPCSVPATWGKGVRGEGRVRQAGSVRSWHGAARTYTRRCDGQRACDGAAGSRQGALVYILSDVPSPIIFKINLRP